MKVTNRNRQSIGGVRRVGWGVEIEQPCDHVLHLLLAGASISDDSGLDGKRRILRHGESGMRGSEHGDAAHVTQLERRLYVHGEEDILNCNFFRLFALDHFLQSMKDFIEALGNGRAGSGMDGPDGNAMQLAGCVEFDDAISSVFRTAIDAEDPHY